jgi:hypothetical protein
MKKQWNEKDADGDCEIEIGELIKACQEHCFIDDDGHGEIWYKDGTKDWPWYPSEVEDLDDVEAWKATVYKAFWYNK